MLIKLLIYSTRKAFLERTVVKLVYKLDGKSTASFLQGELTAKMCFKHFLLTYIHTYIYIDANTDHPCSCKHVQGKYWWSSKSHSIYSFLYDTLINAILTNIVKHENYKLNSY